MWPRVSSCATDALGSGWEGVNGALLSCCPLFNLELWQGWPPLQWLPPGHEAEALLSSHLFPTCIIPKVCKDSNACTVTLNKWSINTSHKAANFTERNYPHRRIIMTLCSAKCSTTVSGIKWGHRQTEIHYHSLLCNVVGPFCMTNTNGPIFVPIQVLHKLLWNCASFLSWGVFEDGSS